MSHEIDEIAGAETVFMVERNMSDADMRGIVSSRRGRGPHHAHKDRVGTWEVSGSTGAALPYPVRIGKVRNRSR